MIRLRPLTLTVMALAAAGVIAYVAAELAFPDRLGKVGLLDYEVFRLVAEIMAEGDLAHAYDPDRFLARQAAQPGFDGHRMFFSYPPPFALLIAPLAWVPLWLGYALFMGLSLCLYLWVLRRLSGPAFHTVLVVMGPLILLILRAGQNGFLTGALMGLAALGALRVRAWAGVPLGLMVIKPHLAVGLGIWALLERRWRLVAVAAITLVATAGTATLVLGPQAWALFLSSAEASSATLRAGDFPLYRMTSVYAFGLSIGLPVAVSLGLHVVVLLAGVQTLMKLKHRGASGRVMLGAGLCLAALVSPYSYDYDLGMLGAAAALLTVPLMRRTTPAQRRGLLTLIWGISLYGFAATALVPRLPVLPISAVGALLIVLLAWVQSILTDDRTAPQGANAPAVS
ncbi:glycosyltransferase family 87 protein [Aliiroseovarius sp.]|uniref:glycosyltransferase family 87 protein n=1 Tax=Aliiroseovarius sp. TaxID=1872442 RepID=UPI003BA96153